MGCAIWKKNTKKYIYTHNLNNFLIIWKWKMLQTWPKWCFLPLCYSPFLSGCYRCCSSHLAPCSTLISFCNTVPLQLKNRRKFLLFFEHVSKHKICHKKLVLTWLSSTMMTPVTWCSNSSSFFILFDLFSIEAQPMNGQNINLSGNNNGVDVITVPP